MFRAPLYPSSGDHDDSVWLPHKLSGSRVAAGWRLSAGRQDVVPRRSVLCKSTVKLPPYSGVTFARPFTNLFLHKTKLTDKPGLDVRFNGNSNLVS